MLEKQVGHESHNENFLPAYRTWCLTCGSCPSSPAWALCTGWSGWSITEGHFLAKNDGMRSGHWLLVTKPAGAGAGARSKEKRPAGAPPLLVKFHSTKLQVYAALTRNPHSLRGGAGFACCAVLVSQPSPWVVQLSRLDLAHSPQLGVSVTVYLLCGLSRSVRQGGSGWLREERRQEEHEPAKSGHI